MNVDCQNSENFYGLNEQIGNAMGQLSHSDLMNSAKEIMGFPGSRQPNVFNGNSGGFNENNSAGLPVKPSASAGGSTGNGPPRGSSNLGLPTDAASRFPPSGSGGGSSNSIGPNGEGGSAINGPNQNVNGGTVYVNSLGQLSTDDNAGFDPKESFLLKPDSDSNFNLDVRGPGPDPIKGIGNSYSFGGFSQDGSSTPIRGSADLSEPVDPSELYNQNIDNKESYLPPFEDGQRKQIYTYPHDIQSQLSNGASPILPEVTGQINTKLAAQGPKYPASQVYGPVASQSSLPNAGHQGGNGLSNSHVGQAQQHPSGHLQGGNGPSRSHGGQQQSSARQPAQASHSSGGHAQQSGGQPSAPYPTSQQIQTPQNYNQHQNNVPNFQSSRQPSSQQQPSRQYLQPSSSQQTKPSPQSAHHAHHASGKHQTAPQQFQRPGLPSQNQHSASNQNPRPFSHQNQHQHSQQQPKTYQSQSRGSQQVFAQPHGFQPHQQAQPFRAPNQQAERRQFSAPQQSHHAFGGQQNQGSNESYLKKLLENREYIHHDNDRLVDLIQRIFVPKAGQRVVSAEVFPSPARETYTFTYNENTAASSNHNTVRHPNQSGSRHQSSSHQHSANCGHPGYSY